MSGVVGSSNNPISGMTLATIITSSVLLLLFLKRDDPLGPAFAVLLGSVVCCAAAVSGDNLQDLKSGHIIGATPLKQQLMQLIGVLIPSVIISPVVKLLIKAYGLTKDHTHPRPLLAPQATLMASVSRSIFAGDLPWSLVAIGMGIAALFIGVDVMLYRLRLPFRLPVLAAALGMYLPFELSGPIVLGGLVMTVARTILAKLSVPSATQEVCQRNGLLFAAGLITGEALVGILLAIPIVITGRSDFMAIFDVHMAQWPGVILLFAVMLCLLFVVVGKAVHGVQTYLSL